MHRAVKRLALAAALATVAGTGLSAPAGAVTPPPPATPTDLTATNTGASISLNWSQPSGGSRPSYFRVYEGSTVVARNDTTHVTIRNLVFDTAHTYTVTAVAANGTESAPSAPISRTTFVGGAVSCAFPPSGLTATAVSASGVSLSWSNAMPGYVQQFGQLGPLVVYLDSVEVLRTPLDSARISGLAPSSTHMVQVGRLDCLGRILLGPSISVTTASGTTPRPAIPTGLTVGNRTTSSIGLSWSAGAGTGDPTVRYAVYDGATLVATTAFTSATVRGLWRDTTHQFSVSALDAAGNESAQSAPAPTTTVTCDPVVPAPVQVSATAVTPSTVTLSWVSTVEATGFTVYRLGAGVPPTPVTTVAGPSAVVPGLPSGTAVTFAVTTQATGTCGSSGTSGPATTTTPVGPNARPAAPTGLTATVKPPNTNFTGTITLAWSQADNADPAVGFRLYEGSAVLASTPTAGLSLTLPSGPTHQVEVVAVDAAGTESALSNAVTFTVPVIPLP